MRQYPVNRVRTSRAYRFNGYARDIICRNLAGGLFFDPVAQVRVSVAKYSILSIGRLRGGNERVPLFHKVHTANGVTTASHESGDDQHAIRRRAQ